MGRAFEKRKGKKMARWDKIGKAFTRLGREIAMAVKAGGPEPVANLRLKVAIQNAKTLNMPKDRVEAAIKKAAGKDERDYAEVVYEGYGPYGVAVLVETATDNPTRTVANVRSYFTKFGGNLGKTGSLDFIFDRKAVFSIKAEGVSIEDLEFELIDYGAEEVFEEDGEVIIYTPFTEFGTMQKYLDESKYELLSSRNERVPSSFADVTDEQAEEVEGLLERIEEDDDVQAVYSNLR